MSLTCMSLSYLLCLIGLIGLNIRILQEYLKLYRKVQQYKYSNAKLEKQVKKTSEPENIPETTESLLTSNKNVNNIIDYR